MPLEPREEKRVAELEERLLALEERNQRLERLLRSGRAFTNNPLSLDTDLDDLGSVKTFLDFEELVVNPDAPAPGVGRLYARGASNDAVLRWMNESGQAQSFVMCANADNYSVIRDLTTVTVANGQTNGVKTVTHNMGWVSAGVVLATCNNNVLAAAEFPLAIHVDNIGVNSFRLIVRLHAAAAAARDVAVAWYADGII